MATSKEHTGKLLISITDGKKLGEIKGLYLDPDARQVVGVFLGTEGLINRKTLAMPQSAVQLCGIDVWLVAGSDTVTTLDALPDSATFIQVSDLRGREVQTEGGTKIGVVEDVLLDGRMCVLGFILGKVFVQGPLAERKTIIRDAITSLGSKDQPITATMAQAESQVIPSA
ncbi:MAG: PRC-barrel domain-containing protein [Anaerolineae bacterium]|nr:PRC-barrel domain-containing protein [Anaerolineae bacterium]